MGAWVLIIESWYKTVDHAFDIDGLPASGRRRSRGPIPIRVFWCVPEGRVHLVGESPTRVMVGWPGSWQAVWLGNWPCRSPATKAALGGRANRRAVTCVKPEQASKGKLWTPTRPKRGEGSTVWGSSRQMHLDRSTGVVGTARRDRGTRKRGRSTCDEGSDLNGAVRRRSVWKSERVIVPLKPGNAGGGKDPDFWCVFEADEVR
jgi:hypothetical protein